MIETHDCNSGQKVYQEKEKFSKLWEQLENKTKTLELTLTLWAHHIQKLGEFSVEPREREEQTLIWWTLGQDQP